MHWGVLPVHSFLRQSLKSLSKSLINYHTRLAGLENSALLKDQKVARLEADILLKDGEIAHLKQNILLDNDNFQEQESALLLEDERLLCQEGKIPELKFGERPTRGIQLKGLEAWEALEDDSICIFIVISESNTWLSITSGKEPHCTYVPAPTLFRQSYHIKHHNAYALLEVITSP